MFITRINKMFHKHGRIAFGILTIVIIIPFVLYFSATPDDILAMFSFGGQKSNVSMYGKNISQKKLDAYITNAMISMTLQGYQVNIETMRNQEQVLQNALNRVRLLKVAEERGIKVDDSQIASYIRNIPLLQENGHFSKLKYEMFVNYYLGRYRLGEKDLEEAAKEDLIINILKQQIQDSAVVTSIGAREFYNASNETYHVKVASFKSSDYIASVKPTEQELKEFFNQNRSKYLMPAKYKVDVVRFNFISYEKDAEKKVSDKQVNEYYVANKDKYKKDDESSAKKKIKEDLVNKEREKLAKNNAQKFAVNAFNLIDKNENSKPAVVFESFAKKNNYTVHKVEEWLDADTEMIPRLGKLPNLVKAVTHLYLDQPVSNAILDKNAYFVVCLSGRKPARKAEFSEVKDKVRKDYVNDKAMELAIKAAADAATEVTKSIKEKKDLPKDVNFKQYPEFTQTNFMPIVKESNGYLVFQTAIKTKEGTVSKVADTPDGAIIVYVDKIVLPSKEEFEKQKTANLARYKQVVQQAAWSNFLVMLEKESNTLINNPAKKKVNVK